MSREPISNVRLVPPGKEPIFGQFATIRPSSLIGRHIKTSFESESGRIEHMWVFVLSSHPTDSHAIIGKIDNDPVVATQYKDGQIVKVKTCQISQIL